MALKVFLCGLPTSFGKTVLKYRDARQLALGLYMQLVSLMGSHTWWQILNALNHRSNMMDSAVYKPCYLTEQQQETMSQRWVGLGAGQGQESTLAFMGTAVPR